MVEAREKKEDKHNSMETDEIKDNALNTEKEGQMNVSGIHFQPMFSILLYVVFLFRRTRRPIDVFI